MTVAELMALLSTLPADAVVTYPDEYTRSEGWEDGCETAVMEVCGAHLTEAGEVELEGE